MSSVKQVLEQAIGLIAVTANRMDYDTMNQKDLVHSLDEAIGLLSTLEILDLEKESSQAIRLAEYTRGYGDGWNKLIDIINETGTVVGVKDEA